MSGASRVVPHAVTHPNGFAKPQNRPDYPDAQSLIDTCRVWRGAVNQSTLLEADYKILAPIHTVVCRVQHFI
jgi:hypothetical protein